MGLSKLSFDSRSPIDKIISDFGGNTTTYSVGAATLSGGFYLPQTDTLTIANPVGKKCLFTMNWSIDGTNFYPSKARLYQPGNPVPSGTIGAAVGMSVSATSVVFYFTHYYGVQVDFTIHWSLDNII